MSQLITQAQIYNLIIPGLQTVFMNYEKYDDLWKKVYKTQSIDQAFTVDVQMRGPGRAMPKSEGGAIALGTMSQAFVTTYRPRWYSMGLTFSRDAIQNNLYQNMFPQTAQQLRNSLLNMRNSNAMELFNYGFTTAKVSDGLPLFSTQHKIGSGVVCSNTFNTATPLTESSLEDALTQISYFRDPANQPIKMTAKTLYVPTRLKMQASRLLNSTLSPSTGNNAINVIKHDGYLSGGVEENIYLTNPYNWFILTNVDEGFKFCQRNAVEISTDVDKATFVTTIRAAENYAFGTSDWRCAFGVMGS